MPTAHMLSRLEPLTSYTALREDAIAKPSAANLVVTEDLQQSITLADYLLTAIPVRQRPMNCQIKKWILAETCGMIGGSKGAEVFLWSGRQAVFLLLMIFVCAMALAHPVWRHWYELIFPPLLAIMAVLALGYAMRK